MDLKEKIANQRRKIEQGNPEIHLIDSCKIGTGIFQLSANEIKKYAASFERLRNENEIVFFIPASGSGSRMFEKFFTFITRHDLGHELAEETELLLKTIPQLPIFELLSEDDQAQKTSQTELVEILKTFVLNEELKLADLPKGLIPFHRYSGRVLNPFQEHLIQSEQIGGKKSKLHFTINPAFEEEILSTLKEVDSDLVCSFSAQSEDTHSIAFTEQLETAKDRFDNLILRPAGHGALINNLNSQDADLLFIRNIDNIQHQNKAKTSLTSRKALAAKLLEFRDEVHNVISKIARDHAFESSLTTLNNKYNLRLSEKQLVSPNEVFKALNKPMRICGMVKNEGEPGGGPFWVADENGIETRQIIEKSQISDHPEQLALMQTATHFNPVELFCCVRDYKGDKFDLLEFVNESTYFVVDKTNEGQAIKYIEQPGLWNGAMANWLTLFYEIDSDCFSPVKTVMDLLNEAHLGD